METTRGECTERDRLPHLVLRVSNVGNEAKGDSSKTVRLLMGLEQVTRPKTLQAILLLLLLSSSSSLQ